MFSPSGVNSRTAWRLGGQKSRGPREGKEDSEEETKEGGDICVPFL